VRHLYVVPDARRRGVARALLAAVERAAAEHYDALHLRTDTDAADRFYRAAGWCAHDAPTATHRRELGPGPAP
jgi:GNAT superfamily N-acetyltransferase